MPPSISSVTINLGKVREGLLQQNQELKLFSKDLFAADLAQHKELFSVYKILKSETISELKEEDRSKLFRELVSSTASFRNDYDPKFAIYRSDKLDKESLDYLDKLSEEKAENHNFAFVISSVAKALAEKKPKSEILQIFESSYQDLYNSEQGILDQTDRDIKRTDDIVIIKNGKAFKVPQIDTDKEPYSLEKRRQKFVEINDANKLGLTGEQIDYILHSTNQSGIDGNLSNFMFSNVMESGSLPKQASQGRLTCVELDGEKVTLHNHLEMYINHPQTLEIEGTTLRTTKVDISNLKADRLRPGIGSCPAYPITNLTTISNNNINIFNPPESIVSDNKQEYLKEYCKISVSAQTDITSTDKMADFLKEKTNPFIISQMFQALTETKKLSQKQQINIALKVSIVEGELDLGKASELMKAGNPDLDIRRARRYLASHAYENKIKTNIRFSERVSNLFSNMVDKLKGFKSQEQRLYGSISTPQVLDVIPQPPTSSKVISHEATKIKDLYQRKSSPTYPPPSLKRTTEQQRDY